MLYIIGKQYLIEHCTQEFNDREKKDAFDFYCSEILRAINNSVANALGGKAFDKSWKEMLEYKPETRTGDEIKSDILKKLHALGKK